MEYYEDFIEAYGKLLEEYEKQNDRLTELAREENPEVAYVRPVTYRFSSGDFEEEFECFIVHVEGEEKPYIYVLYGIGDVVASFLRSEGKLVYGPDENLPLKWETVRYLYEYETTCQLCRYLQRG